MRKPLDWLLSPQMLLLPALLLLLSPWLFGFAATSAAAVSAYAIGIVLLLLCWAAAADRPHWAIRGALPVGAWALVASIIFGFEANREPSWVHVGAGVLTLLIGVWNLDRIARAPGNAARGEP